MTLGIDRTEPTGSASDKRASGRVGCRIGVHDGDARWEASNISRTGMFLAGPQLPRGAIVTLRLDAPDGPIPCRAEVCHAGPGGLGVRFVEMEAVDARRLRGVVNALQQADELRDDIVSKIERTRPALVDPAKIQELLERANREDAKVDVVTLVPGALTLTGRLSNVSPAGIVVGHGPGALGVGDAAYAALTLDFVCYSFATKRVPGESLVLGIPDRIYTNERRDDVRRSADGLILHSEPHRFDVIETSERGLSVWADIASPPDIGDRLDHASLMTQDGRSMSSGPLVVRNRTEVSKEPPRWRLGLAFAPNSSAEPAVRAVDAPSRAERVLTDVRAALSLFWQRMLPSPKPVDRTVRQLRFRNARGLAVASAFEATWADDARERAPLLIIVAGFGGRKEQMAGLSRYALDVFREVGAPLAVLRLDGTNNIGESDNDEGFRGVGLDTQHYTIGGVLEDVDAALNWARRNPYVDPSSILLMSVSFSSIAVRHGLATQRWPDVEMWIAHMGAADAKDAVLHVSGRIDAIGRYASGHSIGRVMLIGCEVDGDHFCADLLTRQAATFQDSQREMAKIGIPIVWNVGKHDAWMDPRRVDSLLRIDANGAKRTLNVFDSGHVPTSGAEALRQFGVLTETIYRHLNGGPLPAHTVPGAAAMKLATDAEFARVRSAPIRDLAGWWQRYLLGDGALGFDILEFSPHFATFADTQVGLLAPHGRRTLDIGCGTGLISSRIAAAGPSTLDLVDLVPSALERASKRAAGHGVTARVTPRDASGNLFLAVWRTVLGQGNVDLALRLAEVDRRPWQAARDAVGDLSWRRVLTGDTTFASSLGSGIPKAAWMDLADLAAAARSGQTVPALRVLSPDAVGTPLPFPDHAFDAIHASLLLSYLTHPDDLLSELHRVLAPGGAILASSMKSAADTSKLFSDLVDMIANGQLDYIPGTTRDVMLEHGRAFLDNASDLFRLEEEGHFHFYDEPELRDMLVRAGFVVEQAVASFGEPAQAIILLARRP